MGQRPSRKYGISASIKSTLPSKLSLVPHTRPTLGLYIRLFSCSHSLLPFIFGHKSWLSDFIQSTFQPVHQSTWSEDKWHSWAHACQGKIKPTKSLMKESKWTWQHCSPNSAILKLGVAWDAEISIWGSTSQSECHRGKNPKGLLKKCMLLSPHFYRVSISEHRAQESESLRNTPGDGSDVFWLPCETGITETWPVKYEVDLIIDKTLDTECMGFYFVKDRHTTNQNNEQQPCPVSERKKVQLNFSHLPGILF